MTAACVLAQLCVTILLATQALGFSRLARPSQYRGGVRSRMADRDGADKENDIYSDAVKKIMSGQGERFLKEGGLEQLEARASSATERKKREKAQAERSQAQSQSQSTGASRRGSNARRIVQDARGGGASTSSTKNTKNMEEAPAHGNAMNGKGKDKDSSSSSRKEKGGNKVPLPFMELPSLGLAGRWEEKGGNFILRPRPQLAPNQKNTSTSSGLNDPQQTQAPPKAKAVIHFLGGAFVGAAPHITYVLGYA